MPFTVKDENQAALSPGLAARGDASDDQPATDSLQRLNVASLHLALLQRREA